MIKSISQNTEEQCDTLIKNADNQYNDFKSESEEKIEAFIQEKNKIYNKIKFDIEKLLPNALTAGLSHAFYKKRRMEIKESKTLTKTFKISIYGLIAISFIPFLVSIYLLIEGKELLEIVKDMPRMVLSILPLYIPVVWLAYSSNKKINLSKRLIEEYTHKEVLSKTFEGLSKQIENIDDEEISSELRIKLLYNILTVSSENPGKLISDYNSADHPLMDALEKSAKLSDAVDAVSKIPGLSKLTKVLEKKNIEINKIQEKKINEGFNSINSENNEEQENKKNDNQHGDNI